jgi:hypothetical protein
MDYLRKLQPDRNLTGLIPALVMVASVAIAWALAGLVLASKVLSALVLLYAVFSFATSIRTRNAGYLWAALFQAAQGILFLSLALDPPLYRLSVLSRLALVALIFFGILTVYFTFTKKMKWRGREVFELAAAAVEEAGEGYTSRPMPAGKLEYSKQDLLGFAEFVRRHLIAGTYQDDSRILMVPIKMGDEFHYMLRLRDPLRDETWVSFDFEGNLSVHIAQKDYLEFRDALSFDQLCEGLGKLFVEFFESFRRGEAVRVIQRMDALKLSPFS